MRRSKASYDQTLPQSLRLTQEWFASIIARPIDIDHSMNLVSPSGQSMVDEAQTYICASPTLKPHERIEIYNQQYWWRLLKILHDNLPFVTRLFGHFDFNETLGKPYLYTYPANHWSLNQLGFRMPQWIRHSYKQKDKRFLIDAALIDCAYIHSFLAADLPGLKIPKTMAADFLEQLLDLTLYHQPHLRLFILKKHLFQFRDVFVAQEDPDYWIGQDFPPLLDGRLFPIALFRAHNHAIVWKELSEAAYIFLSLFKKGCSINQALEWLEMQQGPIVDEIATNLRQWLQDWIALGWFSTKRMRASSHR